MLDVNIIKLLFNYLDGKDVHRFARINKTWLKAVNEFDEQYETLFKEEFPVTYQIIKAYKHTIRDWREQYHDVSKFNHYFPNAFKIINNKKLLILNWKEHFERVYSSSDYCCYHDGFTQEFFQALNENNLSALEKFFELANNSKKFEQPDNEDTVSEEYFLYVYMKSLCDYDFNMSYWLTWEGLDKSVALRNKIWEFVSSRIRDKKFLALIATLTSQPTVTLPVAIQPYTYGITPLELACKLGNLRLVKQLTEGIVLDYESEEECLRFAILSQNLELIKFLVEEKKVSINLPSPNDAYEADSQDIDFAEDTHNFEIINYLIEHGAWYYHSSGSCNTTIGWALANNYYLFAGHLIKKYIKEPGINTVNNANETLLHIVCDARGTNKNITVLIDYLLKREINVNVINNDGDGYTALKLAINNDNHEVAKKLIQKSAEIRISFFNWTEILTSVNHKTAIYLLENSILQTPLIMDEPWKNFWYDPEYLECFDNYLFCESLPIVDPQFLLLVAILTRQPFCTIGACIDKGAKINLKKSYPFTPLELANHWDFWIFTYLEIKQNKSAEIPEEQQMPLRKALPIMLFSKNNNGAGYDSDQKRPREDDSFDHSF